MLIINLSESRSILCSSATLTDRRATRFINTMLSRATTLCPLPESTGKLRTSSAFRLGAISLEANDNGALAILMLKVLSKR